MDALTFIGIVLAFIVFLISMAHRVGRDRMEFGHVHAVAASSVSVSEPREILVEDLTDRETFQRFMDRERKEVIHQAVDKWGMPSALVRVRRPGMEDAMAVHVFDSTLGHPIYLRVPPTMQRCKQAIAWTFGMTEEEYETMVET